MEIKKLHTLFNPETVAVIGATDDTSSAGYYIMRNLTQSGFNGTVYPVNLKRQTVHNIKAYGSVRDVPKKIDLAIIATPAQTVPQVVEECGTAGVNGIVIISSGFSEVGDEGKVLSEHVVKTARKYGMRVLGPNCLGFVNPAKKLNASFAHQKMPPPGKISFISQSGALGTAILDWSVNQHIGFSHFISLGEMADIEFHDLIDYLNDDPSTSSILIYLESLKDARKFLSAARACARNKPIIVLKAGKSNEGAKAALSHTGSVAGDDAIFDAAFKRAGIIRVNSIGELFDLAKTLSMQNLPAGKRLAIVTNAGGPGVIATDALIAQDGELAQISDELILQLNTILPKSWSKGNPIDVLGDADAQKYMQTVELAMKEKGIDGILVILTPQSMTDTKEIAKSIISLHTNKTILASWMGGDQVSEAIEILEKGNIPVFRAPENAVTSFMHMYNYKKDLEMIYQTPATIPHAFNPRTNENRKLIHDIASKGRHMLTEEEAKQILAHYDIPVSQNIIVHSQKEAAIASTKIGFPVVMKVLSPDIIHKTDVGAVKTGITSEEDAKKAYIDVINAVQKNKPEARIDGMIVEAQSQKKYELLVGSKKDPIFGPVIVFGMGGVAVEVFRDTNVAIPPLNMHLAKRLIEDTKIYKLLKGYRGMPGVDITAIQFLLYKFAYLVMDFPEIQEIDINPLAVDQQGAVVLDAKIILDTELLGKQIKPYSHLVISPYPKEFIKDVKLDDGTIVELRPIKPEDEEMEKEMFSHFSEETQRFRFFTLIKDITHGMLIRYTQIDYDREMAIIAEVNEDGKKMMAGVVRLISDPYNENAEFAIVVADPWQKKGLGSIMMDYILDIARRRGIKKVVANMLPDNAIMIAMFEKRGFKIHRRIDVSKAILEL